MTNPAVDYSPLGTRYFPNKGGTKEQQEYQPPSSEEESVSFTELGSPYNPTIKEEGVGEYLGRGAGRTGARVIETLAGLPGDIRDFAQSLVGKGFKALGAPQEAIDQANKFSKLIPSPLSQVPSSQEIREDVTQRLTGDYLEPRTEGEELYDDIVSDLAALAVPVKGKIPFMRALGTSVGANLGKEGIKSIGGSEEQGQWTKLGLMFMLGSLGRGNARKYANNLYKEAIETIPEDAKIGNPKFTRQVDDFVSNLQKGGMSPQKQPAYGLAKQLREKIRKGGGEISADELPAFRKSINDFRFNRKAGLTDQGRFYLDRFDDVINNQLMDYGKQNPSFLKQYKDANTAIAGFKQSNKVARYISKHFDVNGLNPETLVLLGLHFTSPSTIAKVGAGIGVAKTAQLAKRVATNPVLRKHYENVVKESLKGNAAGMSRNLKKLDEELAKENP